MSNPPKTVRHRYYEAEKHRRGLNLTGRRRCAHAYFDGERIHRCSEPAEDQDPRCSEHQKKEQKP